MSNSFSISTRKGSSNKSRWWFQPNWKKQYQTNWIISPSSRSSWFPRFFWPDAASRWSRLGQSQQPWCGNYFNLPVSCQDAPLAARNLSMTFFSCINHGKSRLDLVLEVSPRIYVQYEHVNVVIHLDPSQQRFIIQTLHHNTSREYNRVTFWTAALRYFPASALSLRKTCAETSSGANFLLITGQSIFTFWPSKSTL